jgi:hypothetical protein
MRYVLIDPYTKIVAEAENPLLAHEPEPYLSTLYEIMDCGTVEWHDIVST